jgi:N-acylneuraminate cytidylyltransferase|tara:strand:+ start:934 stop:1623 length:690 start_codon:yes stop_codon:yes gene_type:complete
MTICVIPARGESKRIPRKNIKDFNGKPMIQWSIEAADASNIFNNIFVSTDDDEIAEIAKSLGAEVPFIRPKELSDDYTNTTDVIAHATKWAMSESIDASIVCCLYATSPFVLPADLEEAHKIITSENWQYVFSASEFSSPIFRSFEQIENGGVKMFYPQHFETRSQDLPQALYDAGMFYMARAEAWLQGLKIFDDHSFPLRIPSWRVQDIDTPEDWDRAVLMAKAIHEA